jgi:alpha-galactosidase/6-phospho-beta-glucosidase family protein
MDNTNNDLPVKQEGEDKIILICAVARSGSTTLQLILNSIPDSNICGENSGAINHLLEFYKQIKYTQQMVNSEFKEFSNDDKKNISKIFQRRTKPAWFNSFDFDFKKSFILN